MPQGCNEATGRQARQAERKEEKEKEEPHKAYKSDSLSLRISENSKSNRQSAKKPNYKEIVEIGEDMDT